MKILIVSGSFYPNNSPRSFRTTELAKEFCRLGHDVTIYIPSLGFDYSEFKKEWPITIKTYKPIPEKRRFVGISIIDRIIFHYIHWLFAYPALRCMREVFKAVSEESGYDLLVTIAVPHHNHWAVGKLYSKGHKIAKTWIADCGDPFMLAGSVAQKPPFWFKPLEKRWCRLCDYIAVPTDTSYQGYYPEFKDKIRVIPQGFNFEDVVLPEYKKKDIPTFAFAGSLIPGKRDPRCLLDWLSTLDMPFRFVAYGSNVRQFMEPYQQRLGDKLVIENPIPRNQLLPVLAKMDFLINIGNGTKVQTPSKLIDYTLTKRPIITIESNDIKEETLLEFLNGDYSHKDAPIDISQYDIHNVAQQFLELIK